jgi:DNA-binding transcriptional LysR family regulator
MNITLRQLRAFVTVAGTGSFTVAARELHLTQSTLTKTIALLEARESLSAIF